MKKIKSTRSVSYLALSTLSAADIDTYRERVACVVVLELGRLTTNKYDDRTAVIKRKIAAYLLWLGPQLFGRDIGLVLKKSEAWVSGAIDCIDRRMKKSSTFRADIEQKLAALKRLCP